MAAARHATAAELALGLFPWLLALLLGVLTAVTGSFIALSCDFLGDLRFGFCRGLLLADRNRCCGGSENVDFLQENCIKPALGDSGSVDWVTWAAFFEYDQRGGAALSLAMYVLASMFFTGLASFLVFEYAPAARGSGIPEVKAAVSGYDLPQSFSAICLLIKALGLSLVVGAGLSLGKEGPLIHIGVCWAYTLQRVCVALGLPRSAMPLHEIACVGAAAGVSTAFGAPLGGVLFAAEELGSVRSISQRTLLLAFMSAFAASFTLKYINLTGANKLTLFALSLPTDTARKEWISWEMLAFFLTGVVGGVVGGLFIKANLWCTAQRRRCQQQGRLWFLPKSLMSAKSRRFLNVCEGVLIALVTSLLSFPFTRLLKTLSTEAIHALFETCPQVRSLHFGLCDEKQAERNNTSPSGVFLLLFAACVRLLQTTYTFGAALPSGLFIPSLYIGACLGRVIGILLSLGGLTTFGVHIEPAMFAMVGAISMLSGFCRMTVSIVVIMFELTGELTYMVPFMCAVLTAKLVGDSMTPSIYDGHAKLNGYAPIEDQDDVRFDTILADIATQSAPDAASSKAAVAALGVPESCVARLTPQAPLLTAYCAFRQKPSLQYCVCSENHRPGRLSIVSRLEFEAALQQPRFALAKVPGLHLGAAAEDSPHALPSSQLLSFFRRSSEPAGPSPADEPGVEIIGARTEGVELQRPGDFSQSKTPKESEREALAG